MMCEIYITSMFFLFQLPTVCGYQTLEYSISVEDIANVESPVTYGPYVHLYGNGENVTHTLDQVFTAGVIYSTTVTFTTVIENDNVIARPISATVNIGKI